ncbi:cation:proton antiporter [Arcobacteraceae bacterium]|nr:cation:proton antiporter [Arcobacteraceae bacterium]
MLLLFTILLVFILLSRIIENIVKIPSTLSLIVLSFLLSYFFPTIINLSDDKFDDILYLMLPVILLPDILNISVDELKKHYKEVIYLAFFAVIISITIAVFITPFLLPEHQFTIGMLIALFSMLMATDAITVSSIMSKFRLPEKLKVYAESESLFNDVTALVIFYFIAMPMISGGALTLIEINTTLIKVLLLSTIIGIFVAYVGYYMIKILKNSFDQLLVIYLIVIVSFMIAEHFQIAGILSIVTSVLTFKYLVKKEFLHNSDDEIKIIENNLDSSLLNFINNVPSLTKKNFREYKKESEFIGIFANAIVFTILANIIDISSLLSYYKEIIIIFTLTTLIRFTLISSMTMQLKLPFRWAKALTYSGAKGALAIIMVHSLPDTFIYKDMFNAIVVGNVLLSTFIYTSLLMIHIAKHKENYENDMDDNEDKNISVEKIVEIIKKDPLTGAYKTSFIKEILEDEIARAKRYKSEFSCILIDITSTKSIEKLSHFLGDVVLKKIRTNDNFGKLRDGRFIVLTVGTSLSGAMILAEKIETIVSLETTSDSKTIISFGITQIEDVDTYETIMEKLEDAIIRAKDTRTEGRIEIEI